MRRFKKHAVWVILIAIIVGVVFMLKSRKVAAYEETVSELRQAYERHAGVALAPLCASPEKCREVTVCK